MKTRNLESVARSHLLNTMKTDKYAIEGLNPEVSQFGIKPEGLDRFGEVQVISREKKRDQNLFDDISIDHKKLSKMEESSIEMDTSKELPSIGAPNILLD